MFVIIIKEVRELKFSHNKEPSCQGKQDHQPIAISGKSPITPKSELWTVGDDGKIYLGRLIIQTEIRRKVSP